MQSWMRPPCMTCSMSLMDDFWRQATFGGQFDLALSGNPAGFYGSHRLGLQHTTVDLSDSWRGSQVGTRGVAEKVQVAGSVLQIEFWIVGIPGCWSELDGTRWMCWETDRKRRKHYIMWASATSMSWYIFVFAMIISNISSLSSFYHYYKICEMITRTGLLYHYKTFHLFFIIYNLF